MVERGPEKAGVGGSIPSLATIPFQSLAVPNIEIFANGTMRENLVIPYFAPCRATSVSHARNEHVARPCHVARLSSVLENVDRNLVTCVAVDLILSLKIKVGWAGVVAGLESPHGAPSHADAPADDV